MELKEEFKKWDADNPNGSKEDSFQAGFNSCLLFLESVEKNKELKLKKLKQKFIEELRPYVAIYGRDMINDFYGHWSQPNKSKTNIGRFMETKWDTERRLLTWSRNNFNQTKKEVSEPKPKKYDEIT